MSKFKFELNDKGVKNLLKSKEMKNVLKEENQKVLNTLGEGYSSEVNSGEKRAYTYIRAESAKARRDNLKNNTLLKAIKK